MIIVLLSSWLIHSSNNFKYKNIILSQIYTQKVIYFVILLDFDYEINKARNHFEFFKHHVYGFFNVKHHNNKWIFCVQYLRSFGCSTQCVVSATVATPRAAATFRPLICIFTDSKVKVCTFVLENSKGYNSFN